MFLYLQISKRTKKTNEIMRQQNLFQTETVLVLLKKVGYKA